MIIKLITHKRNKDGTVILYLDKGLTQEDRHELMDLEGKPLELKVISATNSDYDRGFQEGLSAGIKRIYMIALQSLSAMAEKVVRNSVEGIEAEDGCQK